MSVREASSTSSERCPFCRAPLGERALAWRCPRCATHHHEGCARENGGCTVFGCGSSLGTRPPTQVHAARDEDAVLHPRTRVTGFANGLARLAVAVAGASVLTNDSRLHADSMLVLPFAPSLVVLAVTGLLATSQSLRGRTGPAWLERLVVRVVGLVFVFYGVSMIVAASRSFASEHTVIGFLVLVLAVVVGGGASAVGLADVFKARRSARSLRWLVELLGGRVEV